MTSGSIPHELDVFTSEMGGETYQITFDSGDYIARNTLSSCNSNVYLHVYYWSTRSPYDEQTNRACQQAIQRRRPQYQETSASLDTGDFLTGGLHDVAGELQGKYAHLKHIFHIMPMATIYWESAAMPPTNLCGQRDSSRGIDASTHEMGYHQENPSATEPPGWLIAHTASFVVRRALPMALELFSDLDDSAPISS